MLPIEDLNLKFTLSAYLWEMKILNKALPPSLVAKNIFRKKKTKQRYIHKGHNDDADNNDNNDRPHLFIFQFID